MDWREELGARRRELAVLLPAALFWGAVSFLFQRAYATSHAWQAVSWGMAAGLLVVFAWLDWRFKRIPNPLLMLLLVSELLCFLADQSGFLTSAARPIGPEVLAGGGWMGRAAGVLLPLILFGVVNLFYGQAGIGGGDIKLFMILGFSFGYEISLRLMLLSFLMAAVAMVLALWLKKADKKSKFPLAPAICAAFLVCAFTL